MEIENQLCKFNFTCSLNGTIWTGLLPDWTSGDNCNLWTSSSGIDFDGIIGHSNRTDS